MDWVKCSSKLPENGKRVFIWVVPYDNRNKPFASIGKIELSTCWIHKFKANITHWMYIKDPIGD